MSFITDRMLYGDIKVASQVIRESADLAASEAAKDHAHAMPWAAQIAVRTHTAIISSLHKTLHREQIGDPDMRLSHQNIIAAVCDAANAAGKAVTEASHPTLHSAWQQLSAEDRGAAAGQMGPAIPDDMFTTVPLNGFRTLSLNHSDLQSIGRTTAAVIQQHVPNPEHFPYLRATVSYLRPTQHIDLWCLPHLAFIGNPPQAEMDRATKALNEGLARSSMMMPAITPAEFFAMVKNQADPGNSPATPGT